MLDLFKESSAQNAKFFASVLKKNPYPDYLGTTWVGRSHESVREGIVHHNMKWIREQCSARSMRVRKTREAELNFGNQVWLEIQKNKTRSSCSVHRGMMLMDQGTVGPWSPKIGL